MVHMTFLVTYLAHRGFCSALRPHQVIDRLCPVIVRRDGADVGVAPVLGIRPERPTSVIPLAAARVNCQVAIPHAHVPRPQVGQLVPGLAARLDDLAAQQVAGASDLAVVPFCG